MYAMTEHRQLSEISGLNRRVVTKFHKLAPGDRRKVLGIVAEQITADAVDRAIAVVNGKRKTENGK